MVEHYVDSRIPPRPVEALIIMLACFSLLGLLGNSLVLYVYVRKRNKLSSTVFIIALAATDLVTSAVGMPYTMVVEGLNYQLSLDVSCKLYYFIITCTVPFSVFIMVAIAIDRYLCICRPHSHVLDSRRARNSVLCLLVLAIMIGLVPSIFHGVYLDVETVFAATKGISLQPAQVMREDESTPADRSGTAQNFTQIMGLLEEISCPTCASESMSDEKASESVMKIMVELYKKVCTRSIILNQSDVYTGRCLPNQIIFSENFRRTYQTIYSSSFLVCFSVVFVLYILIYKSVLVRRSKRLAARTLSKLAATTDLSLTENQITTSDSPDKTIPLVDINNGSRQQAGSLNTTITKVDQHRTDEHQQSQHSLLIQQQQEKTAQSNGLRDKYFLANIRTAIMLFVVTLAFVLAYLPSWLMAFKVLHFNVIVFYVYFSNHIVNPIIYAFMNPAFRRSLHGLLCRKKGRAL